MVLKDCRVTFVDVNKAVYIGGETVSGVINITLHKQKKFTDLTFTAKGETRCQWSESHGTGKNRRNITYQSREVHYRTLNSLLAGYPRKTNGQVVLDPGSYSFSFAFGLPQNVPTSLEGHYGRVRHTIKITSIRSMRIDETHRASFSVLSNYNLNLYPPCSVPVTREVQKGFNFLFASKGAMSITVNLPMTGFVPGQPINVRCDLRNQSQVKVKYVTFSLQQQTTYICTTPHSSTRRQNSKLVVYEGQGADKGQDVHYPVSIIVPALPPTNYQSLITNEYFLKIKAVVSGVHGNASIAIPITIGTVPLYSAYYDNFNNYGDQGTLMAAGPSTSMPLPPTGFEVPSAPLEMTYADPSAPPPYIGLPTYEQSQVSHAMTEADPDDKDANIHFSPVYPVYTFPPPNVNNIGFNIPKQENKT